MVESFSSIPLLDLSQAASPDTRPRFLADLRYAVVRVGFFYLKGHRIPDAVQKAFVDKSVEFFDLPIEKKREVDMINSPHFTGYTGYTEEKTKDEPDYRETVTLVVKDLPAPAPDQPLYRNLIGPNQWPSEVDVPGFRQAIKTYLHEVCRLMEEFKILIAEALGLEPTALLPFFDNHAGDRFKLIKYPPPPQNPGEDDSSFSGIGPHKDGTFLTFLLQGTAHSGLEIQNKSGQWIPANPIPGTLVVNIGRLLESLTEGVCNATTHRVSLRAANFVDEAGRPLGPRYSFPVFQVLRWDRPRKEFVVNIPAEIADPVRGEKIISDVQGQPREEYDRCLGNAVFKGYALKYSHVSQKYYPDVLAEARITRI
ncbi:uncharacterized protein N7459_007606 [Penicillium hispanicum]|uniref:uncharacterized protein n=1 Tax=Penicillium hispanicum TaxID=1080232 RepID=UPI002540D5AC|nr:uncharacterized protein N7459_007606 [Penicillium hispanicum]KAJ5578642.1 hypothetical protein N7459_007606 [Penicillium hispanicum]